MPVVRRYQRQTAIGALPSGQKQAAETALSVGVGVAQAQGEASLAMAGFGDRVARFSVGTFGRIQEEAVKTANETTLLDANNRLSEWKATALYDPETGALNKRGKDALSIPDEIRQGFETKAAEIEKGLHNDAQRAAWGRLKGQEWESINLQSRRHVSTEMGEYHATELRATVENSVNEAIILARFPDQVAVKLRNIEGAIRLGAPKLGLGPEAVDGQVLAAQSAIHVGVINSLLAEEQDQQASIYFHTPGVREQIDGKVIDTVVKSLDEGTDRAKAQQTADAILAAGGTLTEQRAKVKAITNAKLRDDVEQRVEHQAVFDARAAQQAEETSQRNAYDILDRTPDVTRIPPADWTAFDGPVRAGMRAYATARTKQEPIETDLRAYYGLVQQAMDDPTAFSHVGLLTYRARLDDGDFKHLASVQLAIRNGDRKEADKELGGTRTVNQIMAETVGDADPKSARVLTFRKTLDRQVEAAQIAAGNKPLRNVEIQEIADNLWQSVVLRPGGWLNLLPGGAPFRDETKPIAALDFGDIPVADRIEIRDELFRTGRPITKADIVAAYIKAKRKHGEVR